MEKRFEVEFLPNAVKFMNGLDSKAREKIYFNIRKAQVINDPELFKKLTANDKNTLLKTEITCLPKNSKQSPSRP